MAFVSDICVVCYEIIKEGWHCEQCYDGAMCFECLEHIMSETCPLCRTDMNKNNKNTDYEDVTCIVDRSHGVATHFCERCNLHLCSECDIETHMYALMRFHVRINIQDIR